MPNNAEASPSEDGSQAPGFYRMMLGEFELTALNDGTIDFPMDTILTNAKPGEVDALFHAEYLKPPIRTSINQFLVNTGSKLVLVDTGAGSFLGPTLGRLPANMKAAGYDPAQIDEVLITHMHVDHVGGLIHDGKASFPNATIHVSTNDLDYWLNESEAGSAPHALHESFEADRASFAPYIASGQVKPFDGDTALLPGISAVHAYGHTPGHSYYLIESEGQQLLLWGDTIHAAAVQFADPSVTVIWDSNPHEAEVQRESVLADAVRSRILVGGAHIAFPGIGHIRTQGEAYAWVPLNYSASV